jgi:hypothetical protein
MIVVRLTHRIFNVIFEGWQGRLAPWEWVTHHKIITGIQLACALLPCDAQIKRLLYPYQKRRDLHINELSVLQATLAWPLRASSERHHLSGALVQIVVCSCERLLYPLVGIA